MDRHTYRAKKINDKEWVYGYYIKTDKPCIITEDGVLHQIVPETLGQCTGVKDINEKAIFEGDIVEAFDALDEVPFTGRVGYENASFMITGGTTKHFRWMDYDVEIIGNIHDNPEILEVQSDSRGKNNAM